MHACFAALLDSTDLKRNLEQLFLGQKVLGYDIFITLSWTLLLSAK